MSLLYLAGCFIAVALFSSVPRETALLLALAALIGFLMNGAVVSLYALGPRAFPTGVRATGIGVALGAGRLGGAIGPYVA